MIRHDLDQPSPQQEKITLPYDNSADAWSGAILPKGRSSSYSSNSPPSKNSSSAYLSAAVSSVDGRSLTAFLRPAGTARVVVKMISAQETDEVFRSPRRPQSYSKGLLGSPT